MIKLPAISYGCFNKTLSLSTILNYEFGGWKIEKNGKQFYLNQEGKAKNLMELEREIEENPADDYRAIYFGVAYVLTYQRHSKNNWKLIDCYNT